MSDFKYPDWNPARGTVPAYIVERHSGQITIGEVVIIDGDPCDGNVKRRTLARLDSLIGAAIGRRLTYAELVA